MIYNELAPYYDQLVADPQATQKWVDFTCHQIPSGRILELACGSGEITFALAEAGFTVDALDLSSRMIEIAKRKFGDEQIHFHQTDMTAFNLNTKFDAVLCYCDSVNYLEDDEAFLNMIKCVKCHLVPQGLFLFDMHTIQRLEEFQQQYIEEGDLDEVQYQWTIQTYHNQLHHHFAFWFKTAFFEEFHVQTVHLPQHWIKLMQEAGFDVQCWTDFDKPEIQSGEKILIAGRLRE